MGNLKKLLWLGGLALLLMTSCAWAAPGEMNLRLTDPAGGSEWNIDSEQTLKWSFRGEFGKTVEIRLQRAGWVHAQMTLAEAAPIGSGRSGSFKWKIPADLPPANDYTVRITAENGISDMSGEFKLVPGKARAAKLEFEPAPKGGERWTVGSKVKIRWNYAGKPGHAIKLGLIKKDEGTVTVIAAAIPVGADGRGSYEWTVPALKPAGDYYLGIASTTQSFYQDTGKEAVTIVAAK